jgi:hypothetical protein
MSTTFVCEIMMIGLLGSLPSAPAMIWRMLSDRKSSAACVILMRTPSSTGSRPFGTRGSSGAIGT